MHARSRIATAVAVAAVYFVLAKLGFTMAFTAAQVTLVWPPTGLSLAVLLLCGSEAWPGVFLGAWLANITTQEPLAVASAIAAGNTLEALVAWSLVRRYAGSPHAVNWLRYALGLVLFGAMASTTISATIGTLSLCAGGVQRWSAFPSLWWTWWLGDAAGDLIVAPAILTWSAWRPLARWNDWIEIAVLAVALVATTAVLFFSGFGNARSYPFEYTLFPFIIWAAIRFGVAGAAAANLVTATVAIWGTVSRLTPAAGPLGDERLLPLQIFLGTVAGTGLLLGATISERDASKARKAGLLEAALDCIISIDQTGRIIEFNPSAERTFGYRRRDVIGREMAGLIIPETLRDAYRRDLARAASGRSAMVGRRFETIAVRANGTEFPIELSITRVPMARPPVFTGFLRDITEQKRLARYLTFRATHDGLTKVLNRAAFSERLSAAVDTVNAHGGAVAVLFVDLDRFKAVNDQLGHAAGDRLLTSTARRLRAAVRPGDSVGRLGGDEFAILLDPIAGRDEALVVVDRVSHALGEPFLVGGHRVSAVASIGVALCPADARGAEDLLRAADASMYRAKTSRAASG